MNTVNHTASIRHGLGHWLLASTAAASMALSMVSTGAFAADELPGKGIKVQPLKSSIAEESFQTQLVMKALEKLGYEVQPNPCRPGDEDSFWPKSITPSA